MSNAEGPTTTQNALRPATMETTIPSDSSGSGGRSAPQTTAVALSLRFLRQDELPLVFSSWLRSFRKSRLAGEMTDTAYFAGHHRLIEQILSRPTSEVACATPEDDSETIVAWVCHERTAVGHVIHYAYTKQAFRQLGIQRRLWQWVGLDIDTAIASHMTDAGRAIKNKHPELLYSVYHVA